MRRQLLGGAAPVERPSANAGHIPSCHGSCECPALSPVADVCRRLLLLPSPLLSGGSASIRR